MKTLPHLWESFMSLVQALPSHPRVRQLSAQMTEMLERLNSRLRHYGHVVRGAMIQRALEFANYLQRIEANAISRDAYVRFGAQNPHLRVPLPAPTFPDPRRFSNFGNSPPPRVALGTLPRSSRSPEQDFDDAPTAIYHPIPLPPGGAPSNHY